MSTCVNYWTYAHQTIRHEMYDGHGPSSQGDAMLGWHQLADRLISVRHYVDTAIAGVQTSQQGAAADAAVGAMTPLGAWVEEARRLAIDTGNRIDEQISAFTVAKGNVPEVPPEPRGRGWKDIPGIDSFTTSDQEIDEAFNQEQQRQARAAMASYQDGTNTRLVALSQFAPPPAGEPNLAIPTGARSEVGGVSGGEAPGGSGLPGSGAAPGSPTTLAGVADPVPVNSTAATPTTPQSGSGVNGPEHTGARPGASAVPAASAGASPGAPFVAGPVGGGSSRIGQDGTRGGSAARGFAAPRGLGSTQGMGSAGVGSHRAAGGFGPTGSPESAARGPSAGAAGAGRVPGAGMSAATSGAAPFGATGGGRSGEDKERRRPSYLVESDADRLIGDLPQTAPAVIGEDLPDDRESHRG
ncbi:MAG: PPE domain-containing protein [Pseudonocardiaceae bacterium]